MSRLPVGSFPFERWAVEVASELGAAGLDVAVDPRGPRAFQVWVSEEESPVAGEILAGLGYLTCPVPAPALGSVKAWRPGMDPAAVRQEFRKIVDEVVKRKAQEETAEAWSQHDTDLQERFEGMGYEDPWVLAKFGDQVAVNGHLLEVAGSPSPGYEHVEEWKGDVQAYVVLPEIRDEVIERFLEDLGIEADNEFIDGLFTEFFGGLEKHIEVTVGGEVDSYGKPLKV